MVKYAGFSGDSVRYVVGLPDGSDILSREAIESATRRFDVGQRVGIAWPQAELNAFAE